MMNNNKLDNCFIEKFDIVKSLAGRDKNKYFLVIHNDKNFLYLADGKIRKIEKPKKKKHKHCCLIKKNKNFELNDLNNKNIFNVILLFKKNSLNSEGD